MEPKDRDRPITDTTLPGHQEFPPEPGAEPTIADLDEADAANAAEPDPLDEPLPDGDEPDED